MCWSAGITLKASAKRFNLGGNHSYRIVCWRRSLEGSAPPTQPDSYLTAGPPDLPTLRACHSTRSVDLPCRQIPNDTHQPYQLTDDVTDRSVLTEPATTNNLEALDWWHAWLLTNCSVSVLCSALWICREGGQVMGLDGGGGKLVGSTQAGSRGQWSTASSSLAGPISGRSPLSL